MTEKNLFTKVDTIPLYGDSIGSVSLYDASHANESEEQRQYTVANIAALAYGSDEAKNPAALYERLKVLHHESCFEFVRSGFSPYDIEMSLRHQHFTYIADVEQHKSNIACFRIKTPIFVARQFMRHRSFSYLEMSRRYTKGSKVPFEFWFPRSLTEAGIKEVTDKCNSIYNQFSSILETQVASRFLPQTTYTEFYMMGEVEGLRNFFQLRLDSHAQAEIRELAEAMLALLVQHQPELANKVKA